MTTFLLVQADPGYAQRAASYIETLPGVGSAVVTSGPFDVVVELTIPCEGDQQDLLARVRRAPGLVRLCVCRPSAQRRTAAVAS